MTVDQSTFRSAILDPERSRPEGLTDGSGRAAGRRFDVYRNNVAVSLADALETAFPVIRKLLGEKNFRAMSGVFLRKHPPTSPLMMFYGSEMPEFLARFEPTASIGYLPDVARLEIALRESYHAADAAPIDPTILQSMPPERLMASRVSLDPAIRLIRSSWPVHAIWQYNTVPNTPKPTMTAEDVATLRVDMDPHPRLLPAGAYVFLKHLLAEQTFAQALDAASAETAEFDLSGILTILIGAGAITCIGD